MSHNITSFVSIHIITYNQIDFIHETLISALEQDYENLEVVVADDGSTDGTAEVILEYAAQYPNRLVPLVSGPNLGITGNSNRGLKACKGKYIAFQGGDDVLLSGKITAQVAWMEEDENRVLCGHQVEYIDKYSSVEGLSKKVKGSKATGKGSLSFLVNECPFAATSIMVRASSIPEYGFDERLSLVSDWKLWLDCLVDEKVFGVVDGVFSRYRIGEGVSWTRKEECHKQAVETILLFRRENAIPFYIVILPLLRRFFILCRGFFNIG